MTQRQLSEKAYKIINELINTKFSKLKSTRALQLVREGWKDDRCKIASFNGSTYDSKISDTDLTFDQIFLKFELDLNDELMKNNMGSDIESKRNKGCIYIYSTDFSNEFSTIIKR